MNQYKPPYSITSKMVNLISAISEELTRIEFNENKIITPKLRKINRIKTLVGTLEIEGNFLGEEKITAILEGKRVLGTLLEVTEVEGAIKAYKSLEKYSFTSIEHLLEAHHHLMNGVLKSAGKFRTVNVGVGNHIAPPCYKVDGLMMQLFEWLQNTDEHPLIASSVFHFEFEFIHPFADGNGRIGRLWQSVILYNWKKVFNVLPTESIVRDRQQKYYDALGKAGNLGESTPFLEFMLEAIFETVQQQTRNANQESNQESNQEKIVNLIYSNNRITIKELSHKANLSESGVKKIIKKLKEQGKLQRTGALKGGHWTLYSTSSGSI